MTNAALVSVIIPAFNMAKFLPEAVRSVLAQTYSNVEAIVVDDGSTDDTREVMQQFRGDPRVVYRYQPNSGVSSARNHAIKIAKGEFIGFCDADDIWVSDKLELQVPCFAGRPGLGVVYGNPVSVDSNNNPIYTTWRPTRYNGFITDKLLQNNFVSGCSSLVRKICFDDVGLFDVSLKTNEDYDLWLRISVKYEFFYLDKILYRYRQWDGQVSQAKNELQFYEDALRVKKAFIDKHPELVPARLLREIWAGLYSGRAQCVMRLTSNRIQALRDILRALCWRPARFETWKSLVKVLINRVS